MAASRYVTARKNYDIKEENNFTSPITMIANANNTTTITAIVSKMLANEPRMLAVLDIMVNPIRAYAANIQERYNETLPS